MTTQDRPGETPPIAFLSVAFRPFFLLGSLWSALALGIWVASLAAGFPVPAHLPAMEWHIHEMLFGFGGAAIAGFLLTAVANWTGRPPVRGAPLAALVLLWCLGRAANLAPMLPPWLVTIIDCLFPLCVAIIVARELIAAGNRRNLVMVALLLLFGCADLLMYLDIGDTRLPPGVGWRLALAIVVGLIALIGARIIPAFTRNWLGQHDLRSPPDEPLALARAAPVILLAGLGAWAIAPDARGGAWAPRSRQRAFFTGKAGARGPTRSSSCFISAISGWRREACCWPSRRSFRSMCRRRWRSTPSRQARSGRWCWR